MLSGIYQHQIDQKWRLRLPSKLKEEISSKELIAYRGANSCLVISTKENFDQLCANYYSDITALTPGKKLNALRHIMATTFIVDEDSQGRFSLPAFVRTTKEYNFTKDVVFVGMIDHIELWSQENYDRQFNQFDNYDELLEELASNNE